jgi:inner membrane protein
LGAACGEAVLGKKIGNKALFFGAIGGTLPDLDVFVGDWLYGSEIQSMAYHRGFMHSIFFAILGSLILGFLQHWIYNRRKRIGKIRRQEWIQLFFWSLLTHSILDCFTAYGTQLFAPFSNYRVAFDNISVADPLYTLPFLICIIVMMFFKRSSKTRSILLKLGFGISSCYMLFTFANKAYVHNVFKSSLQDQGIEYLRFRTQPTILNNILWYGIAESESCYYAALYSILDGSKAPKKWQKIPKNHELLPTEDQDIKTLIWFSNGFYSISETDEKEAFIFKDLRYPLMDEEDSNSSVFSFLIKKENNNWMLQPIYMDQPNEKNFKDFWNRLKGI